MNATDCAAEAGLSKQRLRLWVNLLRTTRSIEADLREEMRRAYGSTLPRFDVLSALERHAGGLLMGELSRHLMVSNGNVTGIVERLVADGLVERLAVEGDRRAILVRLTPQAPPPSPSWPGSTRTGWTGGWRASAVTRRRP